MQEFSPRLQRLQIAAAAVPNMLQQKIKASKQRSNASRKQASNQHQERLLSEGWGKKEIQPIFNFTTPSLICPRIIPNELVVQRDSINPHKTKQELKTTTNNKNTKSVHSSFNSITCIIQPEFLLAVQQAQKSKIEMKSHLISYNTI